MEKNKITNTFNQIVSGYSNLVKSKLGLSSDSDEKIFKARRAICNACEHKSALDRCLVCGCPLAAKTRSLNPLSACPNNHW
tara:strand:+ start:932 stop:1174 length:243 start_codon:yes stop_codon:yes gene_type:complete